MDKRLLFSAILAASIGANEAQAIELSKPVLKNPLALNPETMTGTDTVYIYNVKADKWLAAGNAYGTQTSLSDKGMKIAIVPNQTKKKNNGTFSFWNNSNNPAAGAAWTRRMFFNGIDDNGGTSYVDRASQAEWKCNWVIRPKGTSFELQADTLSANSSSWDAGYADIVENSRAGWNPNADETDGKGEAATSGIFRPALNMNADDAASYGIEWQAYAEEDYLAYANRVALKKAIEDAGDVDVSKAIAVYNNENATNEELESATQYVKDQKRNASMTGASIDNPVNLNEYLANPSCDDLTGWTYECVYDKDGNVGSGGHGTNWQAHSGTYTSEDDPDYTSSRFIERWVNSGSNPDTNNEAGTGHLSDGVLSQKLTNLPKGAYRLSCYAMATQQGRGDDYTVEGVSLFAQRGSGEESAKAVATKNGKPKKFQFLLYLENDDDLTIGFKLDKTTANWAFVDEFKLEYCGPDAAPMYLQQMNEAKESLADLSTGMAYQGYLDEASEEIAKADGISSDNTSEEIQAQTAKMQELITKIKASQEKYQTLTTLNEEINDWTSQGNSPSTELQDLLDDCDGEGTTIDDLLEASFNLDNDAMDAYMAKLNTAFEAARKNAVKKGDNLTYKIANPTFEDGSKGWTDAKTVSSDYQNCEAYQGTFDMYQDITDLQVGVYKLTAQAMHRTGNNDVASVDGESQDKITAVLYANDIESKFASPYSYGMATKADNDYTYTKDGNEVYIPNSMKGFKAACDEDPNAYLTTVYVLVTDGNLRIGVRETQRPASIGDWAIWDNFQLTYVGNATDADAIAMVSGPVIAQAQALYDKPMATTELNALKKTVEELETNGSNRAIKAVAEATKAAQTSITAYETLNTAISGAETRYELNEATAKSSEAAKAIYNDALNTAKNAYSNGTVETADVPEAIKNLNIGITKYVINDALATATAEQPVDISSVIVNNNFYNMDATGWSYEGGAPGFQASNNVEAGEFYNRTYNLKQEIVGLPAGIYYLKAKAFYREGNDPAAYADEDETIKKYAQNDKSFLYFANDAEISETAEENKATYVEQVAIKPIAALQIANNQLNEVAKLGNTDGLTKYEEGEDENSTLYIPNDMTRAQAFFNSTEGAKYESDPVKILYNGKSKFYIGLYKTESVSNDWTIFKDFTLQYAGNKGLDTGINNIAGEATGDVIGTKIYNAAGVQTGKLQKGINIVVSTLSDGSKKVSKVIVK